MKSVGSDELRLDGIHIEAVVGFSSHEVDVLQPLEVDLLIQRRPLRTDTATPELDYKALKNHLRKEFLAARFHLIEAFAEAVAECVLGFQGVEVVRVTVHKPGALTGVRDVSVRMTRSPA